MSRNGTGLGICSAEKLGETDHKKKKKDSPLVLKLLEKEEGKPEERCSVLYGVVNVKNVLCLRRSLVLIRCMRRSEKQEVSLTRTS